MGMHHVWPCGDLEHQFLVTVRKGFLKRKVYGDLDAGLLADAGTGGFEPRDAGADDAALSLLLPFSYKFARACRTASSQFFGGYATVAPSTSTSRLIVFRGFEPR